jgi:DNA polymerase-3 subunit alpha
MEDEIKETLTSRKQKVEISSELLATLENKEVHYKLN